MEFGDERKNVDTKVTFFLQGSSFSNQCGCIIFLESWSYSDATAMSTMPCTDID